MGKTYRKEKPQYKKAREDDAGHKRVDHDHDRTSARKFLNDARYRYDREAVWDEDQDDE